MRHEYTPWQDIEFCRRGDFLVCCSTMSRAARTKKALSRATGRILIGSKSASASFSIHSPPTPAATGATGCTFGRGWVHALAGRRERGVEENVSRIQHELATAMILRGCNRIDQAGPDILASLQTGCAGDPGDVRPINSGTCPTPGDCRPSRAPRQGSFRQRHR